MYDSIEEYEAYIKSQPKERDDSGQNRLHQAASEIKGAANAQNANISGIGQLIQSQQQQIQQLNMNINMLVNQMRVEQSVQQRPAYTQSNSMIPGPSFHVPHADVARMGSMLGSAVWKQGVAPSLAAGMAGARAFGGLFSSAGYQQNMSAGPGNLSFDGGAISNIVNGSSLTWNPANARSYTFGAYQRGINRAGAESVSDFMAGTTSTLMGTGVGWAKDKMLSAVAGLIPGGGILKSAYDVSAALGVAPQIPDPISFGIEEAEKSRMYGAAAGSASGAIMRGAGSGTNFNRYGMMQESQIGRGVTETMMRDLTYDSEDVMSLQKGFAQTGHLWGATDPDTYKRKFKQLIGQHKVIMKTLQQSTEEALDTMNKLDYELGVGNKITGGIYSAANTGNMSVQDVLAQMKGGAGQAIGKGLMAGTGARAALGSIGTAGTIIRNSSISDQLYSTVGGEEGIRNILNSAQTNFSSGIGGSFMAMGGDGSLKSGLSGMSKLKTGSDIMGFLANRHTMVDQQVKAGGTFGQQIQMANQLRSLAKSINPKATGKELKNIMAMMAKNMGYVNSSAEAETLIESFSNIEESVGIDSKNRQLAFSDMQRDQYVEQYGLMNRITLGARQLGSSLGGHAAMDAIENTSTKMGMRYNKMMDEYDNMFLPERIYVNDRTSNNAVNDKDFISKYNKRRGSMSSGFDRRLSEKEINNLSVYGRKGTDAGDFLDEIMNDMGGGMSSGVSEAAANSRRYAMLEAVSSGQTITSREDLNKYMRKSGKRYENKDNYKYAAMLQEMRRSGRISEEAYRDAIEKNGSKFDNKDAFSPMSNSDMINTINKVFYEEEELTAGDYALGLVVPSKGSLFFAGIDEMFGSDNELTDNQKLNAITDPEMKLFLKSMEEVRKGEISGLSPEAMDKAKKRLEAQYAKVSKSDELKQMADAAMSKSGLKMKDGVVDSRSASKDSAFGNMDKFIEAADYSLQIKARDKFIAGGLNKAGMGEFTNVDGGLNGGYSREAMAQRFNDLKKNKFKDIEDEEMRNFLASRAKNGMSVEDIEQLMAQAGQFSGNTYEGANATGGMVGDKATMEMVNYIIANTAILQSITEDLNKK